MKKFYKLLPFILICTFLFNSLSLTVHATQEEFNTEAENRKLEIVQTNEIEGWPTGPVNGAESAILMDADSGAILYAKNIEEMNFPASTTKIMTCLVAVENCNLDEIITVSQTAIDANASDGSNMGLHAGEKFTLEELLYGILINSANEGCNAVAEHIAGSQDAYVKMMNDTAKRLGCTNTHFVTTNGLHDDMHYTTAHDMALIAQAFFSHDILCKISCVPKHCISANEMHEEHYLSSHNKLYKGMEFEYEYLVGSKTGFTSHSRQTLVSCAQKDGMRLICVIMKEESPYQFDDTIKLFDYGFSCFDKVRVNSFEENFSVNHADFFDTSSGLFGSTKALVEIDNNSAIIIPKGIDTASLSSNISYAASEDEFASINYYYNDVYLGSAKLILNPDSFTFTDKDADEAQEEEKPVMINVNVVLIVAIIFAGIVIVLLILSEFLKFYHFDSRNAKRRKAKQSSKLRRKPVSRVNRNTVRKPITNDKPDRVLSSKPNRKKRHKPLFYKKKQNPKIQNIPKERKHKINLNDF